MESKDLMRTIALKVKETIDRGNELYPEHQINIKEIRFDFSLKGRTAGEANWSQRILSVNLQLVEENLDNYLYQVIPHEIAHFYNRKINGFGKNIKSHGEEWKKIMISFGRTPDRCHSYKTTKARKTLPRNQKEYYVYKCYCREWKLTINRHNKNNKHGGVYYKCPECKGNLKFTGKTTMELELLA